MEVVLGFLLGILLSLGCLFLTIFLGMTISPAHQWLSSFFNGSGLLGAGIIACRRVRESSYALGVVIALSLAFLINSVWGIVYFR